MKASCQAECTARRGLCGRERDSQRRMLEKPANSQTYCRDLEMAIREIHHRFKNYLNLITLRISCAKLNMPDGKVRRALAELESDIQAVGSIHETLIPRKQSARRMPVKAKPEKLLCLLASSTTLNVRHDICPISLETDAAGWLILVTHEIVFNSLKQARSRVSVRLSITSARASLEILDDGPGFKPGFVLTETSSVGLYLAQQLAVRHLNGRIVYGNQREGGARVVVTFPADGG